MCFFRFCYIIQKVRSFSQERVVILQRFDKLLRVVAVCLAAILLLVGCGGGAEEETTEATVFVDTEAPQITGVQDYTVHVGDRINFLEGIDVTDNADPSPKLRMDTNSVFLDYPGTYTAIYIAWDESGNESRSYATVTVQPNI